MTIKLPRALLVELDNLIEKLAKGNLSDRDLAMSRLVSYENSGKIPLSALIELAGEANPSMAMYGIMGLGRNKTNPAVNKLIDLAKEHREGNVLFLQTIVDSLGEAGNKAAAPVLMDLIGIGGGLKEKMKGWFSRKAEAANPAQEKRHEHLLLPVVRALDKVADKKTALALAPFLDHMDSLLRWHAIEAIRKNKITDFNDKLEQMAAKDINDTVKEAATIALGELDPLPKHLKN